MDKRGQGREAQFVLMNVEDAIKAVGGFLLFGDAKKSFSFVSIDSRTIKQDSLFIPLSGERVDGHDFIEDAIKNGATVVFVDNVHKKTCMEEYEELAHNYDATFICLNSTLKALHDLAGYYLDSINLKLKIGITGSSGKTTVKEMLGCIFSKSYKTYVSPGNLNSSIGLPLSVFMLRREHEVGVFEMGMNRVDEIKELASVLRPNVAIITNVGTAHIGMLGSKEAILQEKLKIFSYFEEGCVGFVPKGMVYDAIKDIPKGRIIEVGEDRLSGLEGVIDNGLNGSIITYKGSSIKLRLLGSYNVANAILSISVATYFNIEIDKIKKALSAIKPSYGRAQIIKGFTTCFFDCYNANPDSMREAINFCSSLKIPNKKIAILGSMLELGKDSIKEHAKICELAFSAGFNRLYFFGNEMLAGLNQYSLQVVAEHGGEHLLDMLFAHSTRLHKDDEFDELEKDIIDFLKRGDFVLLKASRALRLERLCDALGIKGENEKNKI